MLSREENEMLTRTGPGTPMGELLRRFWLPALLPEELPGPDCTPVRLRLLSEDLVAFRDTDGKLGLLDAYCAHRRAHLFFGRNEECGIRCIYHGWKYDVDGNCVDLPTEPPESNFKDKVKLTSYSLREAGGIIWAPKIECLNCRDCRSHRFRRITSSSSSGCRSPISLKLSKEA